jgi:hypothetical protein
LVLAMAFGLGTATGPAAASDSPEELAVLLGPASGTLGANAGPIRFLDHLLVGLDSGDTIAVFVPDAPEEGNAEIIRALLSTRLHWRPAVRDHQILATRDIIGRWLGRKAASKGGDSAPLGEQLVAAAQAMPPSSRPARVVVIGAVAVSAPPPADELRQLAAAGIRVSAVDVATSDEEIDAREKGLEKWRERMAAANVPWEMLPLAKPNLPTSAPEDQSDG